MSVPTQITDARLLWPAMRLACVWMLMACASTGGTRGPAPIGTAATVHADSVLVRDEAALYRAAISHAMPGDAAYDVERAIALFEAFISTYPASRQRADAAERLALLHEIRSLRLQLHGLREIDTGRRP